MTEAAEKMKVSNPERILRVLQRVAAGGLSVQVRALSQIETAVKGRAVSSATVNSSGGFSIGGISERGRAHLAALAEGGLQIEFVLMSAKIVFFSRIMNIEGNGIMVSLPDYLMSIERRKDSRFPVTTNTRGYVRIDDWHPEIKDPAVAPFFEYQREMASLLHVGDVSMGGLSIVSRFPAACRILQRGSVIEKGSLVLPLSRPIPIMIEVRWVKRLKESVQDYEGAQRVSRVYKFGIQFMNPSQALQLEMQKFMARLAIAEAI